MLGSAMPRLCEAVIGRLKRSYFSDVLIAVNFVRSELPTPLTAVTIATAMPAAIRLYSMAVAPVSSVRNLRMVFIGR